MTRRAARLVNATRARNAGAGAGDAGLTWAGTFHAIANRLLRLHATAIGLAPAFTLLDREDAADLLDQLRHARGLARTDRRFPRKGTCLAIYSRAVNTQEPLRAGLEAAFPWCLEWEAPLRDLFAAYVDAKAARAVLDYDDLLLYWFHLMSDDALAARIGALFDHVLVDEYQDTNTLQAEILRRLKPDGRGVTVVGDDAQAIYSFRAACVDNILAFPRVYDPPAAVVTLEQNYRSTAPILDAANAVIALATERYEKNLFSLRRGGERPQLATVADELAQVDYVVRRVLERREAGVPLRQQAVLFRAAHHSDALEVELGRRNIPFVKFGGLRFLEAAHVKDALACLRWAENPRDTLAAFRVAQLLPGMGPRIADRLVRHVSEVGAAGLALPRGAVGVRSAGGRRRGLARVRGAVRRSCAARRRRRRRRGRRRWAWCGAGTSRTSSGSTTTRACASAISSSWSSWRPPRRRASASSPTSRSTRRRRPAPRPGHRTSTRTT